MTKSCFIISSIGKEGSDTRKEADEKFELIFEPILKEFNYKATRADKIGIPGSISREIISNVINSDLVIADVSDENPNVFYELAIRNAVKKPVIVFRGIDQPMPFDIYDKRSISIDRTQPRIWENAKNALRIHITEAEKNPKLASDSILTNVSTKFEVETNALESPSLYPIIKDLQEDVRKLRREQDNKYVSREEKRFRAIRSSIPLYIVSISQGSSVPGCEKTNKCFVPSILKIKKGETVLWSNEDSAAHTVTSGTAQNGPDGYFDSSLFMSGNTFSHTFDMGGEYPYFDLVHPWMNGKILVK